MRTLERKPLRPIQMEKEMIQHKFSEKCDVLWVLIWLVGPPQMWIYLISASNQVCWPQSPFMRFSFLAEWSQVYNSVSILPWPCPWNWNFLVFHMPQFQQASSQLSFNHRHQSYRCVWLKYKVSVLCFGTHRMFLSFTPKWNNAHVVMSLVYLLQFDKLNLIMLLWLMFLHWTKL